MESRPNGCSELALVAANGQAEEEDCGEFCDARQELNRLTLGGVLPACLLGSAAETALFSSLLGTDSTSVPHCGARGVLALVSSMFTADFESQKGIFDAVSSKLSLISLARIAGTACPLFLRVAAKMAAAIYFVGSGSAVALTLRVGVVAIARSALFTGLFVEFLGAACSCLRVAWVWRQARRATGIAGGPNLTQKCEGIKLRLSRITCGLMAGVLLPAGVAEAHFAFCLTNALIGRVVEFAEKCSCRSLAAAKTVVGRVYATTKTSLFSSVAPAGVREAVGPPSVLTWVPQECAEGREQTGWLELDSAFRAHSTNHFAADSSAFP